MAANNQMYNYLLMGAAAWLAWEYLLKPAEQLMPASANASSVGPENGSVGGGNPTIASVERQMKDAAQGDTLPFNQWRWNWYYERATGNPAPNIHTGLAFPGKSTQQIENEILSFQSWLTLARQYAVNPETQRTGGWDPITGGFNSGLAGITANPMRRPMSRGRREQGVSGLGASAWGQSGSARFSNWAGGSASRNRSRHKGTVRRHPGRPVIEMPRR